MPKSKYSKYLNQEPVLTRMAHHDAEMVTGRTWPQRVYMSKDIVPGCPLFVEFGWIYDMPKPNPHLLEMTHSNDEVVVHIGNDYRNPTELGAEIEFVVGDEKLMVNKTGALYIPKGVKHGPLTWKSVSKPHLQIAITLGGFYD